MQLIFKKKNFLYIFLLVLATLIVGCSSSKTIVHGVDERDANEILVLLASKGILATKIQQPVAAGGVQTEVLYDITVSQPQSVESMALLDKYGLPRKKSETLLNIFPAGGLVPSESQQKIRYQAGLATQIASVIRKFNGVLDADVVISFPETNPLNPTEKTGKITASVWVKHNGVLDDPNSHLKEKIKRLVASSVPGLNYDDVSVVGDLAHLPTVTNLQSSTLQQTYVKVWGLTIEKDSLRKFQIIFFILIIFILVLALVGFWVIWKILPIAKKRGGIRTLFHLSPLKDEHTEAKKEEEKKDDDKGPGGPGGQPPAAGGAAGAGPKVQENVESP